MLAAQAAETEAAKVESKGAVAVFKAECRQLRHALIIAKEELLQGRKAINAREETLLERERQMLTTLMEQLQHNQTDVYRLDDDDQASEAMYSRIESLHELMACSETLRKQQALAEVEMTEHIRALPPGAVSSVDLCSEQGLEVEMAVQMAQIETDGCLLNDAGRILTKLESLRSELGRMRE
jgi:hypothetical protein